MRWNEWIDEAGDTVAVLSDAEHERFADLVDLRLVGRREDGTLVWRRLGEHVDGFCPPRADERGPRRSWRGAGHGEASPVLARIGRTTARRLVAACGHRRRLVR